MKKRLVAWAAQAAAVVVAVVAGFPAAAATAGAARTPGTVRTVALSCDFSALGGPTAVQEPAATLSVPATGTTGTSVTATFRVPAISVPAAAAKALAGVTGYQLELSGVTATDPDGTVLKVSGDGATQAAASPGQIPAISGRPGAVFLHPGTGHLTGPGSLTLTPSTTAGTRPALSCTATRAAPAGVTVTAARAGQAPASSGDYFCQAFFGRAPFGSDTERLPLAISVTGPHTVGATDQVTVSGTSPEFVSSWPHAEDVTVTGSIQVTGAQSGTVAISEHANAAGSNPLGATGSLRLTRAGAVSLHLPGEFVQTFSLDGPPSQDSGTHDCKLLTLPAPAGLVLHVTVAGAAPAPSRSPHSGGSAAAHRAVPAGAPGTGGGHGPGGMGLLLALGGAALLLAGGTAAAVAVRRRRGVTGS